jgi:hypothetical protein
MTRMKFHEEGDSCKIVWFVFFILRWMNWGGQVVSDMKHTKRTHVQCIFYNFIQWTNKCTINWQIIVLLFIILLLHVSTLLCHLQGTRSQYLAKLHTYVSEVDSDNNTHSDSVHTGPTQHPNRIHGHHTGLHKNCNDK